MCGRIHWSLSSQNWSRLWRDYLEWPPPRSRLLWYRWEYSETCMSVVVMWPYKQVTQCEVFPRLPEDFANFSLQRTVHVHAAMIMCVSLSFHHCIYPVCSLTRMSKNSRLWSWEEMWFFPKLYVNVSYFPTFIMTPQLTSLVTSFYTSISQNFTDPSYLFQIRTIGFLAQFESLLSSAGDYH